VRPLLAIVLERAESQVAAIVQPAGRRLCSCGCGEGFIPKHKQQRCVDRAHWRVIHNRRRRQRRAGSGVVLCRVSEEHASDRRPQRCMRCGDPTPWHRTEPWCARCQKETRRTSCLAGDCPHAPGPSGYCRTHRKQIARGVALDLEGLQGIQAAAKAYGPKYEWRGHMGSEWLYGKAAKRAA
jgi:hypothetical protein